jgi:hypothetical protein
MMKITKSAVAVFVCGVCVGVSPFVVARKKPGPTYEVTCYRPDGGVAIESTFNSFDEAPHTENGLTSWRSPDNQVHFSALPCSYQAYFPPEPAGSAASK